MVANHVPIPSQSHQNILPDDTNQGCLLMAANHVPITSQSHLNILPDDTNQGWSGITCCSPDLAAVTDILGTIPPSLHTAGKGLRKGLRL